MIKTHKYLNLKLSTLNISFLVLKELKRSRKAKYNELYKNIAKALNEDAHKNFLYALSFLFTLGVVEYNQEDDSVELII